MNPIQRTYRFFWRLIVNAACTTNTGRNILFPPEQLSSRFGRGDATYAWNVFLFHFRQLSNNGFVTANRILEVGPGRNLGTSLLWKCYLSGPLHAPVEIVCWDVFKNADTEAAGFWQALAKELLDTMPRDVSGEDNEPIPALWENLRSIADGREPGILYQVMPIAELMKQSGDFDLVYSQAAIEHIWFIEQFWEVIARLTNEGGWHSHRIDLADHGRRETNYIEMLQWSEGVYWMTQRFVPGAINRWRASDHLHKVTELNFKVLHLHRDLREKIPIPRRALARTFRNRDEIDLRTTGLDLVVRKGQ
jgi:hypothetical protein